MSPMIVCHVNYRTIAVAVAFKQKKLITISFMGSYAYNANMKE